MTGPPFFLEFLGRVRKEEEEFKKEEFAEEEEGKEGCLFKGTVFTCESVFKCKWQ